MQIKKANLIRDKKYLAWVRTLPSAISGVPGTDAHHLIGHMTGGTKGSDLFTFPLTRVEHTKLHDNGYKSWEALYGSQWKFVAQTLEKAIQDGVFEKSRQ